MPPAPSSSRPRVYLETFGCQMNVLDSQLVTGQLRDLGYGFTDDWASADVVLFNTCSVREVAENKVWSRIGLLGQHKREHPHVVVGVIGCMAERDGEDLLRRHPQVNLMCGPAELDRVPALIDNELRTSVETRSAWTTPGRTRTVEGRTALRGGRGGGVNRRTQTLDAAADTLELVDLSRAFSADDTSAGGRSAYVRITRGCNKLCTYCVVPHTRGEEVHRPPDAIVEECRKLADAGVLEVTLLGQTVNHYHFDRGAAVAVGGVVQPQVGTVISPNAGTGGPSPVFSRTTVSFADLLHRIHEEVPGIRRLRFVTSYPRDFGDDILAVMRDSPRICRYLHLPVQSGSDRVLARMNRGYRAAHFRELVERVRHFLPDAQMATDVITGFPGETEEDHQATFELLRWARFKNSFLFKYSPRPGTPAFDRMEDDVPTEVKRRRNRELVDLQNGISAEISAEQVGKRLEVFVEGVSAKVAKAAARAQAGVGVGGVELGWETRAKQPVPQAAAAAEEPLTQLSGRTGGDLIAVFEGPESLIGTLAEVEIEAASALTLKGRIASDLPVRR
ncbi:MiaB/RimO family radical SAM methylthiotransferase [Phycisphaera mikurensis]|uniref:(Dimethylallyl)adenosine tRNA methylthiotransferase MiaB n=1 Tax=Phycisphaera mikurensis (strain NBRC 102666 / KCTC 22515 / FYK2301M01) TaxID=1142394 RepID=I0IFG8_PHYMF|nr:MiaB/RimO family radical SAM methylthiotransferase [Phycisphaera mikurensis]MBB6440602.1 tRNA-2-methylthio-N6-dimethylallyladenosine synthase [Phycisphaera mikurensis]BAM04006.1 (dimethylallyl)adenosine tRNA methylthiotransferase MiaB [Phycisphaera mikurensis NBRC 102666]